MLYLDWKVGDKVICLERCTDNRFSDLIPAEENEIYTIRRIASASFSQDEGEVCILLMEIVNKQQTWPDGIMSEPAFLAKYFRKLVDQPKSTDISMLTDILKTKVLEEVS